MPKMGPEPRVILDNLVFPECPRWRDGRLWFSDMRARQVKAVDMEGRAVLITAAPDRPSGLGFTPDGRLLLVLMRQRKLLRLDGATLTPVADLSGMAGTMCNDMVVDAQGRAYIGNMDPMTPGNTTVAMATPDGRVRVVADDMASPNGMAITPDGRTLIVAESRGHRLSAFDIQPDGGLANRRVWAPLPGYPDGICLDAEGCVWVAFPNMPGTGFIRVAAGGQIKQRIDVPTRKCLACMLGGPDRKTLFMVEAREGFATKLGPGNGRIRAVQVDVPGAGLP